MLLLASTAVAAPPPIAGPCCGAPPLERIEPLDVDLVAHESFTLAPRKGAPVNAAVPLFTAVCKGPVGPVQAGCPKPTACRAQPLPDGPAPTSPVGRYEVGGGRSIALSEVAWGGVPCVESYLALEVAGPTGATGWITIVPGGGGTKGATSRAVRRVSPLPGGLTWIEVQRDANFTTGRTIEALGYVLRIDAQGIPELLAEGIPIWVDSSEFSAPRQIDAAVTERTLVVTPRTERITAEQSRWLGVWTFSP